MYCLSKLSLEEVRYAALSFDLVDHKTVEDKGGQILPDEITACDVADRLATELYELRPELRGKGYSILVSGPDGGTVHNAPVEGVAASKRTN